MLNFTRNQRSLRAAAAILALVMLMGCFAACGSPADPAQTDGPTLPQDTAPAGPTAPADGNPDDITCKGSYTLTWREQNNSAAIVAVMDGKVLNNALLQIYYWEEIQSFLHRYGGDTASIGLDLSQPLDIQNCTISDSAMTWQQYFLQEAIDTWAFHQSVVLEGEKQGFRLDPSYQEYLASVPELLKDAAEAGGYVDGNDLLVSFAGEGASTDAYIQYLTLRNQCYLYFNHIYENTFPTVGDVTAYFETHQNSYRAEGIAMDDTYRVDFRHILLIPQGGTVGDDGTLVYTEEEWNACYKQANTLLNEWLAAKNKADRFCALANEHSMDPGSNTSGGLYTGVQQGQMEETLDQWLFERPRSAGEYALLQSSVGYHLVYFCGSQENWYAAACRDLTGETAVSAIREAGQAHSPKVNYSAIQIGLADPSAQSHQELHETLCLRYLDVNFERYPTPPQYYQQDYRHVPFGGNGNLATHGCGIATMAMFASYMTDTEYNPEEIAQQFASYGSPLGTSYSLYDEAPRVLGFYLEERTWNYRKAVEALERGQYVVCLQQGGIFTSSAHFLILTELTEDNKIKIMDCNVFNPTVKFADTDYYENGFSIGQISDAGAIFWIYEKKVTNIPACGSCGTPEGDGVITQLFTKAYQCPKCTAAEHKHETYHAAFEE